jgi:CheY-like chemotaxis protein
MPGNSDLIIGIPKVLVTLSPILKSVASDLRILLVENHPDVARLFTLILRTLGHDVVTVATIKAAQQAVADGPFDLLMCDYYVSDGNAIALIESIRSVGSKLKCVCVSGAGAEIQQQCMDAGFDVYLRKPVTFEVVESTIASLWPAFPVETT